MPQHRHFEVGTLQSPKGAGCRLTLYARQQFHIHFKLAQAGTATRWDRPALSPRSSCSLPAPLLHACWQASVWPSGEVDRELICMKTMSFTKEGSSGMGKSSQGHREGWTASLGSNVCLYWLKVHVKLHLGLFRQLMVLLQKCQLLGKTTLALTVPPSSQCNCYSLRATGKNAGSRVGHILFGNKKEWEDGRQYILRIIF